MSERCMVEGCNCVAYRRGNCVKHWRKMDTEVRAGRTTWAKLEEEGKVSPKKTKFPYPMPTLGAIKLRACDYR